MTSSTQQAALAAAHAYVLQSVLLTLKKAKSSFDLGEATYGVFLKKITKTDSSVGSLDPGPLNTSFLENSALHLGSAEDFDRVALKRIKAARDPETVKVSGPIAAAFGRGHRLGKELALKALSDGHPSSPLEWDFTSRIKTSSTAIVVADHVVAIERAFEKSTAADLVNVGAMPDTAGVTKPSWQTLVVSLDDSRVSADEVATLLEPLVEAGREATRESSITTTLD